MDDDVKRLIREYVKELVEEFLQESGERKDYIFDLHNCLRGALGEYYKARYAEANGDPDPAERRHWDREVDEHMMFKFRSLVNKRHRIAGDHRKAFKESLEMLRKDVPGELARSKYEFAKALLTPRAGRIDVKNVEDIPDSCTDEFFARVENAYEELTGAG